VNEHDNEPPIRLILAALFFAARVVSNRAPGLSREEQVAASVADADELLRQAPLP